MITEIIKLTKNLYSKHLQLLKDIWIAVFSPLSHNIEHILKALLHFEFIITKMLEIICIRRSADFTHKHLLTKKASQGEDRIGPLTRPSPCAGFNFLIAPKGR